MACDYSGEPIAKICTWLVSEFCQWIVEKVTGGVSPETACAELGLCGTVCECGVCNKAVSGPTGRCLGLPYSCSSKGEETYKMPNNLTHTDYYMLDYCAGAQCDG